GYPQPPDAPTKILWTLGAVSPQSPQDHGLARAVPRSAGADRGEDGEQERDDREHAVRGGDHCPRIQPQPAAIPRLRLTGFQVAGQQLVDEPRCRLLVIERSADDVVRDRPGPLALIRGLVWPAARDRIRRPDADGGHTQADAGNEQADAQPRRDRRSEERRVGKECRSRW